MLMRKIPLFWIVIPSTALTKKIYTAKWGSPGSFSFDRPKKIRRFPILQINWEQHKNCFLRFMSVLFCILYFLYFVHFVVPMGIFSWEIRVAFPAKASCNRVALPNPNELTFVVHSSLYQSLEPTMAICLVYFHHSERPKGITSFPLSMMFNLKIKEVVT